MRAITDRAMAAILNDCVFSLYVKGTVVADIWPPLSKAFVRVTVGNTLTNGQRMIHKTHIFRGKPLEGVRSDIWELDTIMTYIVGQE